MKSGLTILIRALEVPFLVPPKMTKGVVLANLGVPKMALRVPKSKFKDHLPPQTSPQNPQKDTSGTQIGPRKVIFSHFIDFGHFPIEIPIVVEKNYGQRKEWSYSKNKKCSEICEQNGTT